MPDSIFIDRHDNLYVGEKYGFRVRKVDARTGVVSTVVGTGVPGFGEDGDVGERTQINSTEAGLWVDPDGSVLWTDCSRRLRRLDAGTRIVTTLLGGTSVGDGELARKACLAGPSGLSVSPNGTIYFADTLNLRIRAIDPETWQIRTVAGNGARAYGGDGAPATEAYLGYPYGVALDREGNLYVADTRHSRVRRVDRQGIISAYVGNGLPWDSGDGGPAISASVTHPHSVVIGPEGHLYLGDAPGRIRRVDRSNGMITTVVGTGIQGYRGDGGPARQARISSPSALAFDAEGNLYFADTDNHCVRKVDRNGTIHTVVGTGEPGASDEGIRATKFRLKAPRGVAVDAFGILYVSDTGNSRVVAVAPDRRVVTLAGTGEAGDSGDGGPARQCRLNHPYNIVVVEGCLLVSDHLNNRIRAVKLAPLT